VSVLIVAAFGFLVWAGRVTPAILLTFVVVFGTGAALIMPAWHVGLGVAFLGQRRNDNRRRRGADLVASEG
jgi:hypothetical protein